MTNSNSTSEDFPPKHVICVGAVVTKGDQILLIRQALGHALEGQWSGPGMLGEISENLYDLAAWKAREGAFPGRSSRFVWPPVPV